MKVRGRTVAFSASRLLVAAALTVPIGVRAEPLAGNPAAGRQIATTVCAACHQVTVDGPVGAVGAPSFLDVAAMPSTTALSLKVFLRSSHRRMPNFIISESDTNDLIGYILGLRQDPAPGRR